MSDLTRTIQQVNRGIRAMQIIAGNPTPFMNGFQYHVWSSTVEVHVWDSYDPKTSEVMPGSSKKLIAGYIREMRRALPGCTTEKTYDDHYFTTKITSGDICFTFHAARNSVCEKVVIGTETVEEIDYDAAPRKMVEKEIVEWKCDSILESA